MADSTVGKFFTQGLPDFLNDGFTTLTTPLPGTPSIVGPSAYPDASVNDLFLPPRPGGPTQPLQPGLPGPLGLLPPPGTTPPPTGPVRGPVDSHAFDEKAKAAGAPALPDAPVLPMQYSPLDAGAPAAIVSAQTRADEAAGEQ